jgi:hypothetical protein
MKPADFARRVTFKDLKVERVTKMLAFTGNRYYITQICHSGIDTDSEGLECPHTAHTGCPGLKQWVPSNVNQKLHESSYRTNRVHKFSICCNFELCWLIISRGILCLFLQTHTHIYIIIIIFINCKWVDTRWQWKIPGGSVYMYIVYSLCIYIYKE